MKVAKNILGASAAALLLAACSPQEEEAKTIPQLVGAQEVASATYTTSATLSGEVKARVASELSFRVAGRIAERTVNVGDHVKAGDLLARIDPKEQRADVAVAKATVQSAEAQYRQASLSLERQKSLLASKVSTQETYDNAEETYRTAKAALDVARTGLATAVDALTYTELHADGDGVITARNAEVGQVVQAAESIFTLAHDGPRDAVFDVFEGLLLRNERDSKIGVSLLSDRTRVIAAPVREVAPTINAATGTIRLKADLADKSDSMPLGAAVSGVFSYTPRELIVLPWSAMASVGGEPAVWLIDPGTKTVSLRKVEVGDYETERFTVTGGLRPKDLVVTDGAKLLAPGEAVSIIGKDAQ
ncbi:efflux RND transporter periplasmic adaptor subunit [Sinorhizobium sp. BG8]|uniref:efflux RND transporter periplasmic adaptor subunit n=1 Tax=Sinorhizobium sp. BG8 TaxID=2613773 RepID=UPI00193E1060|nr:efflux RND transporter periplasmic adaptor subunit [Sinorhizobium sp. BG8]QRM57490.1 efflux RND transporter periplasmic adaptor subunit [Sinorhizobium sp. BG8]